MANGRPRGSSIFSGLMLIFIGALLLLHNYGGFELTRVLFHWWPVLLIFWGAIKLYERTAGAGSGGPGGAPVPSGERVFSPPPMGPRRPCQPTRASRFTAAVEILACGLPTSRKSE